MLNYKLCLNWSQRRRRHIVRRLAKLQITDEHVSRDIDMASVNIAFFNSSTVICLLPYTWSFRNPQGKKSAVLRSRECVSHSMTVLNEITAPPQ